MKKILLAAAAVLFITPLFVLADDGPQFACFSPKLTLEEIRELTKDGPMDYLDTKNEVRGTCKKIEISTIISLDPVLQKDYLLGEHSPLNTIYDLEFVPSKYSENLTVMSSSTLIMQSSGVVDFPSSVAVFDKAYFIPLLTKLFKNESLVFSENSFPIVSFNLYKKGEVSEDELQSHLRENPKIDALNIHNYSYGSYMLPDQYNVVSFKYQEYGKYVHAPKSSLIESQYADVEKGQNILTDEDLQIKDEPWGHWGMSGVPVVALTSPLKSVADYWIYTKKNGKLVLAWQKSEYVLDNGTKKVITNADKNVSAALLFSNSNGATAVDSPDTNSPSSSSTVAPSAEPHKDGFFVRIFKIILSWFK